MAKQITFEPGTVIGTREIVGFENHAYITKCTVCETIWTTGLGRLKKAKFEECRCDIIKKMRKTRVTVKVVEDVGDIMAEWLLKTWFKKRRRA